MLAEPLEDAVDYIYKARNTSVGGWRYRPGQVGDTSVMGWLVMALTSCEKAGIEPRADILAYEETYEGKRADLKVTVPAE